MNTDALKPVRPCPNVFQAIVDVIRMLHRSEIGNDVGIVLKMVTRKHIQVIRQGPILSVNVH